MNWFDRVVYNIFMHEIIITNATANNLKNISLSIPLGVLVAVVGKSGSGKSSLVYDVLYKASKRYKVPATVKNIPRTYIIEQKTVPSKGLSLCETTLTALQTIIAKCVKGDLLIADEPTAGMNKKDRYLVLNMLKQAIEEGISVIVVEHSREIIVNADYIIEFGPGAGFLGGNVVFMGTLDKYKKSNTLTAECVFIDRIRELRYVRNPNKKAQIMHKKVFAIKGITKNNLENKDIIFPLSSLVCISGGIGSGKSTILSVIHKTLFKGRNAWKQRVNCFSSIEGKSFVRRSYLVDQLPLSNIATSTPATYLGVWNAIRDIYAKLPSAKELHLTKSNFSFNVKLDPVTREKVKLVRYEDISIFELLEMTVDQALLLFSKIPLIVRKLKFFQKVGLGYLALDQRSGTLSGGEAQRVKLAKILSKKLSDRCVYILDNPTKGLHLSDIPTLVEVLQEIADKNNTVLIAENREELTANADFVINL